MGVVMGVVMKSRTKPRIQIMDIIINNCFKI